MNNFEDLTTPELETEMLAQITLKPSGIPSIEEDRAYVIQLMREELVERLKDQKINNENKD